MQTTAAQPIVEWETSAVDRCDAECSAQAYVKVVGIQGDLMFCGHHYQAIMNNFSASSKLSKFAYQTIDNRDKLIENRLVGEN